MHVYIEYGGIMLAKAIMETDQIDCLIEHHIKGIEVKGVPYELDGIRYACRMIDGQEHHMPLLPYSKVIGHAWELVSSFKFWYAYTKLEPRRQRMEWSMANDLTDGELCSFILIVHDGIQRNVHAADGITLERAICLAVLRAKGIEVEDDLMDVSIGG
jgi:hypothetical protein